MYSHFILIFPFPFFGMGECTLTWEHACSFRHVYVQHSYTHTVYTYIYTRSRDIRVCVLRLKRSRLDIYKMALKAILKVQQEQVSEGDCLPLLLCVLGWNHGR